MRLRCSSFKETNSRAQGSPLRRTIASTQICCAVATGISNSSVTQSPIAKELRPETLSPASETLSQRARRGITSVVPTSVTTTRTSALNLLERRRSGGRENQRILSRAEFRNLTYGLCSLTPLFLLTSTFLGACGHLLLAHCDWKPNSTTSAFSTAAGCNWTCPQK